MHGRGVFTTRRIKDGETICYYSGTCYDCVHGSDSPFILQTEWRNPHTGTNETWYLDGRGALQYSGRYINDACDLYGEKHPYKTKYTTNCRYKKCMNTRVDDMIGKYVIEILAEGDIPKHCELFTAYGKGYWDKKEIVRYGSFDDPDVLRGQSYEVAMKDI